MRIEIEFTVHPGEEIILCSNTSVLVGIRPGARSYLYPSDGLKVSGQFILADKGDEVLLFDSTALLADMVAYGESEYRGEGWEGQPVGKPARGHAIQRRGASDTNSSFDWSIAPPGRSRFAQVEWRALVEPFIAPQQARCRLLRELSHASSTVSIAVYELEDPIVAAAIAGCARRGLDVKILIEGQPVGGLSKESASAAVALDDAGCEVLLSKSWNGYKRYDYIHCKYAVFDNKRTLVMSDNWVAGALDGNRGWGVVVDSKEIAAYMTEVFDHDTRSLSLDVSVSRDVLGKAGSAAASGDSIPQSAGPEDLVRYFGTVSPIVSPDFSAERLLGLIRGAKDQILMEQFYCDLDWSSAPNLVDELFSAASRGVRVRVLLDSSWFNSGNGRNNSKVVALMNERARSMGVDLEARGLSPYHEFRVLHNKGLIIDDTSIVSSMNWGYIPFYENREVGFEIESAEVASFFRACFWRDWAVDPLPPTILLEPTEVVVVEGSPVLLDASSSTDNVGIARIIWYRSGDGSLAYEGPTHAVRLPSGVHNFRVVVTDVFNNSASADFKVIVLEGYQGAVPEPFIGIPLAGLATGIAAWWIYKRIKSG